MKNDLNTLILRQAPAPLTTRSLSLEITKSITLGSFLTDNCTPLTNGKCKIYATTTYKYFKYLKENRPVNEGHVLSLMNSFTKEGYLFTIVYVNDRLEIIDGQHRFEAAKRKKLPVYFVIMPNWGITEVTMLNMNSRNWTIGDFMESHAQAGNSNYIAFKKFFNAHAFDVTTCQLIMTGRRSGGHAATDDFRQGKLKLYEEQVTDAYKKAAMITDFKAFHPLGWTSRSFAEAMLTLFSSKNYDHDRMCTKLKTYPDLLLAEARSLRAEEYLIRFRERFNYRQAKDKLELKKH